MVRMETYWLEFWEEYLPLTAEPNESGWVNVDCQLPTHGKVDHDRKGAVNAYSGNYRCFRDDCMAEALKQAESFDEGHPLSPHSQIIPPAHTLKLLNPHWSIEACYRLVESYREQATVENKSEFHDDSGFAKGHKIMPVDIVELVQQSAESLFEDLPIVQEYMQSRGLTYETLAEFGIGYFDDRDHRRFSPYPLEWLVMPYWFGSDLVGVRLRSYGGVMKRMVKNSTAMLFNFNSLYRDSRRIAVIVEGESDTMVMRQILREAGHEDIPITGTPGDSFRREWRRAFQNFHRVLFVPQSDRQSEALLHRDIREALAGRVETVLIPFGMDQVGKDIADFNRSYPQSVPGLVARLGLTEATRTPVPYLMSDTDLLSLPDEDSELIEGLADTGTKMMLSAQAKAGKTFLGLNLADSVIYGNPFLGVEEWRPKRTGRVLLVEEEGSTKRLAERWRRILGDQESGKLFIIHRQGVKLDSVEGLERLRSAVLEVQPTLLILDPYANLHSQDENEVMGTMKVMDGVDQLLRIMPDMTILLIHHSSKGEGADTPRGSGAIKGSMDTLMYFSKKSDGTRELRIEGRDLAEDHDAYSLVFDPQSFRFTASVLAKNIVPTVRVSTSGGSKSQQVVGIILSMVDRNDYTTVQLTQSELGLKGHPMTEVNVYKYLIEMVEAGTLKQDKSVRPHQFSRP